MTIRNVAGKLSNLKYSRSDRRWFCGDGGHNYFCRVWNRHQRHSWRQLLATYDVDLED